MKFDESDEADEVNEADEVDEVDEVDEANKAILIATNEAEDAIEANKATETEILGADDEANVIAKAAEANEAHVIVEVAEAKKSNEIDEAIALEKAVDALVKLGELCLTVVVLISVFSLMKYSVIFTEVEGDFGKINNQLGTVEIAESVEIWSKLCSLRD